MIALWIAIVAIWIIASIADMESPLFNGGVLLILIAMIPIIARL